MVSVAPLGGMVRLRRQHGMTAVSTDPAASQTRSQIDWLDTSLQAWEPTDWPVAPDWRGLVDGFFASAIGLHLGEQIAAALARGTTVYPAQPLRALDLTPLQSVRVVIVGQDPYHGPGQANGLAFSVAAGVTPPPSLRNIAAEIALERRAGHLLGASGTSVERARDVFDADLTRWAKQGVLLLNTCLTVEAGRPASHSEMGWEALTGKIIDTVNMKPDAVAYLLWGRHAQNRQPPSDAAPTGAPRLFLRSNHPSPLSARRGPVPFLGCGHFAKVNVFLRQHGLPPIDW